LTELKVLDLNSNNIDHINSCVFENCKKLRDLNLGNNKLKQKKDLIGVTRLEKLKRLDLSRNLIEDLAAFSKLKLSSLQILVISFNPVEKYQIL